jgi:hypothetical protein
VIRFTATAGVAKAHESLHCCDRPKPERRSNMTSKSLPVKKVGSSQRGRQEHDSSPSAADKTADPPVQSDQDSYRAAVQLLADWKAEESGYDEQTWPLIRKSVERNRLSLRPRFSD